MRSARPSAGDEANDPVHDHDDEFNVNRRHVCPFCGLAAVEWTGLAFAEPASTDPGMMFSRAFGPQGGLREDFKTKGPTNPARAVGNAPVEERETKPGAPTRTVTLANEPIALLPPPGRSAPTPVGRGLRFGREE